MFSHFISSSAFGDQIFKVYESNLDRIYLPLCHIRIAVHRFQNINTWTGANIVIMPMVPLST